MILGLHHTAISTHDIERLAAFYCTSFGLVKIEDSGWSHAPEIDEIIGISGSSARFILLNAGNQILEIFQFSAPVGIVRDQDYPVNNCGITHICFGVRDIDAEYKRLSEAGMRFNSRPVIAGAIPQRAVYGRDPDGNVVELLEIIGKSPFDYAPRTPSWRTADRQD